MTYHYVRFFTHIIIIFLSAIRGIAVYGQQYFTQQDSLRGFLNEFRSNYDVIYYDLTVKINPDEKSISGVNHIHFKALEDIRKIQVDLFSNLSIDSAIFDDSALNFSRIGNAFYIDFPNMIKKGAFENLSVYYHGIPIESKRPPWDGGFIWQNDSLHRTWIGVACEGLGASSWWPNKDHLSDEPDSMLISCIVPTELKAVSNGRFINKFSLKNNMDVWQWFVSYPINNYNVTVNIGHYVDFSDVYRSDSSVLDLNYFVLDYNINKARIHFRQVRRMLECYEHFFGKYPFWKDGYKLVEAPFWGMEHQSAIAYGNDYVNNEFGFDFIIIHESGHEYFGNSISCKDHGELWIHESFTTYMEALYVEYLYDFNKSVEYLETQKPRILNKTPIIGPLNVNYNNWQDADMYFKGSWMLHSIRNTIDNDTLWFDILFDLYQQFKLSNVSSDDIIQYINNRSDINLIPIFTQYLHTTDIPELHYLIRKKRKGLILSYYWEKTVDGFNMPVLIRTDQDKLIKLYPGSQIKKIRIAHTDKIRFATDLYYFKPVEK